MGSARPQLDAVRFIAKPGDELEFPLSVYVLHEEAFEIIAPFDLIRETMESGAEALAVEEPEYVCMDLLVNWLLNKRYIRATVTH